MSDSDLSAPGKTRPAFFDHAWVCGPSVKIGQIRELGRRYTVVLGLNPVIQGRRLSAGSRVTQDELMHCTNSLERNEMTPIKSTLLRKLDRRFSGTRRIAHDSCRHRDYPLL